MKFYGNIGFGTTSENVPGVWEETIVERPYYGDVIKDTRKLQGGDNKLNDNINISNRLSIVADPFARDHFHSMRYVEWMGSKWKISDVEVSYPRLILSVGGLYNE